MIEIAISMLIISIVIPMIFKSNISTSENQDRIVFEFNKTFKIVMLLCTLVFIGVSLIFFIIMISSEQKDGMIAVIFFALFAMLSSVLYLLVRNKKIIYENSKFYEYNILGKQTVFEIQNLNEAIEKSSDGMTLVFKDNKKIKIDMQMNNYSKIKEILDHSNIIYKDKNGNKAPKGW